MARHDEYRSLLIDAVEFRRPVADLWAAASVFPHDFEGQPVVLTKKHLSTAIKRFMAGEISADELVAWADFVEGRSGIEYASGSEELVSETLFKLSTPATSTPITPWTCRALLNELGR